MCRKWKQSKLCWPHVGHDHCVTERSDESAEAKASPATGVLDGSWTSNCGLTEQVGLVRMFVVCYHSF